MTTIFVRDEDIEGALQAFKKKIGQAGLIAELRHRAAFEPLSERRRRKKREGRRRVIKKLAKRREYEGSL